MRPQVLKGFGRNVFAARLSGTVNQQQRIRLGHGREHGLVRQASAKLEQVGHAGLGSLSPPQGIQVAAEQINHDVLAQRRMFLNQQAQRLRKRPQVSMR